MKNCETAPKPGSKMIVGITSMLGMNSMQMFKSKKGLSVVKDCKFYSLENGLNNMSLFKHVDLHYCQFTYIFFAILLQLEDLELVRIKPCWG